MVGLRADLVRDFAARRGPGDSDDVPADRLAPARDLRADSAEAQDHDGGAGERLVGHALIEDAPPDLVGPEDDVLRGRKEEGHRVLRDRDAVRARVAAHDRPRRKPVERQMVDSGHERLDQPELPCLLSEIDWNLPRETHAYDDLRGRPCVVALRFGEAFEEERLEIAGGHPHNDRATLRVHRYGEEDPG